ncbi:MAG: DHH family phosphoesterase, partial [Oscillospiraceae bacterium]|nr:DHH family phosphoesterase [Oscillospiraceae bacterium]
MKRLDVAGAAALLRDCEDVHILIHRSPDGDCTGSGYALQAMLRLLGKRSKVLCAEPIPARFQFLMPEEPEEDFPPKYVIAVDVADEKLLGDLKDTYAGKINLCMDHHVSNLHYAENLLLDADASAACEVLYAVFRELGVTFTEQIAKCLYTGMAMDTGCFKFSNTRSETHIAVAEIMREFPDIRYDLINRNLFDVKSRQQIRAEMAMLSNMEYHLDDRCTIVWATKAVFQSAGVDENDVEGLTSLSLQPEGVEVGLTVKEREPDAYKVSMRSAKDVDVSAICQQFGGGGHVKAAGCLVKGTPEEVRTQLLNAVA